MSIPPKVSMSSCLTCQRATGLLTPPSSLPSSSPESLPEDTTCFDCHKNSVQTGYNFDTIQSQQEEQSEISKKMAIADSQFMDTDTSEWLRCNTFHHRDFNLETLSSRVAVKNLKVTVIVPAKEVASSIGGIIRFFDQCAAALFRVIMISRQKASICSQCHPITEAASLL